MAKSLKDIVEEGFSRLSLLSEKRKELLERLKDLSDGAASRQCLEGVQKLESTQEAYANEIVSHIDRSKEVLQLGLKQVIEDNENFVKSLKENLRLRVSKVEKDLSQNKESYLAGSTEKFQSTIRPLEKAMQQGSNELKEESLKLLAELETICGKTQKTLLTSQSEFAAKLSESQKELSGALQADYEILLKQSEQVRQQVIESLEKLYGEQSSEYEKLGTELDKRISIVVGKKLDSVKKQGKDVDKSLDQSKEEIVAASAAEIVASSQQILSQLKENYDSKHQDLSNKLSALQGQTDRLLKQVKEFLCDLDENVRANGGTVLDELKAKPKSDPSQLSGNKEVEDTIKVLSRELETAAIDMKRQLTELLRLQSDRLSNLCSSAESSLSASAQAAGTEMKQLVRLHEQNWAEKEQDIHLRLRKLEKEAQDTLALISDAGLSADGSTDGGV